MKVKDKKHCLFTLKKDATVMSLHTIKLDELMLRLAAYQILKRPSNNFFEQGSKRSVMTAYAGWLSKKMSELEERNGFLPTKCF